MTNICCTSTDIRDTNNTPFLRVIAPNAWHDIHVPLQSHVQCCPISEIIQYSQNGAYQSESQTTYGNEIGKSEEHTSELQSLMRISYAVFSLKQHKNLNK